MKAMIVTITSLVLTGSLLSIADAAAPSDVPTAIIKLRGLDITRQADQEQVYFRLMRAAHAVCSPGGWSQRALVTPQFEACIDQAVSGAVARFNRTEFTDYVAGQTSKSAKATLRVANR